VTALARAAIDRDSPVPFYFQVVRVLEEEIAAGRWPAGDQLLSEPALGERFGVSRGVIRQALARLERDGYVLRVKGRGTFVAGPHVRSWRLQSSAGFSRHDADGLGGCVTSRTLRAERAELPPWAAEALALPPGSDGVTIERLRDVDGHVALYTVNHLPLELSETVLDLDDGESLYERLERRHGLVVDSGRRVVQAVAAGRRLAELLEVSAGTPLIHIESVACDGRGMPFDCFQSWLRPDRTRVEVEIARGDVHT
jgi:GntR family transcriptional regulator